MREVEKLYYKVEGNYPNFEETTQADGKLEEALGKDMYYNVENYIHELTSASEKQGFVYGFKYAVSLLKECM